jgi:hypothetical protein
MNNENATDNFEENTNLKANEVQIHKSHEGGCGGVKTDVISKVKGVFVSFIPALFAIIIAILFFKERGLFSDSDIFMDDYPRHIFASYIMWYNNILQFNSVFGYYPQLYSGQPVIQFYPVGMYFIMDFLHLFGISYSVALKIIIFGNFFLLSYCPYWVCKIYRKKESIGILASAWLMFAINGYAYELFKNGMMPYLLASFCTVFLLSFIEKRDFTIDYSKNLFTSRKDIAILILFVAGILINYMSIIFAGAAMVFYLLYLYFTQKDTIKNYMVYCIKLTVISFLLVSFWIIPTIFVQIAEIQFNTGAKIFGDVSYSKYLSEYHRRNYLWLLCLPIIVLLIGLYKYKSKQKLNFMVLFSFYFALFMVYVVPFFNFSLFSGVNAFRYLFFFEISAAALIASIIDVEERIKEIRRVVKKIRNKINTWSDKLEKQNVIWKTTATALFIILTFGTLLPFRNPVDNFQGFVYGLYRYDDPWNTKPEDFSVMDSDLKDLVEWITDNTDNESRILIQDSGEESRHEISRGHNLCLVACYTQRYYANGYLSHDWYKYSANSTFLDDYLFGIHLNDTDNSFIYQKMETFNVEYIITWSKLANDTFNSVGNQTGNIVLIKEVGKFNIFKILNCSRNYANAQIENLIWNSNKISFNLNSNTTTNTIVFKTHDFPNWNIFVNGIKVEKSNKISNPDNLIMFDLPEKSLDEDKIEVEIVWKVSAIENVSVMVSICTLIGVILYYNKDQVINLITKMINRKKEESLTPAI